MRTRAVFFDFGGTLANSEGLERLAGATMLHFAEAFGLDSSPDALMPAGRAAAARAMQRLTVQSFYLYREVFQESFHLTFEPLGMSLSEAQMAEMYADFVARLASSTPVPVEGAHETLAALRRRGLITGIVSNADTDTFPSAVAASGFEEAVDFALCSEEARSCKPDAGIFREALQRARCAPEEALFVGDQPEQDIAGANRAGLRSVLYVGPGAALTGHIDRVNLAGDTKPRHTIARLGDVLSLLGERPQRQRALSR